MVVIIKKGKSKDAMMREFTKRFIEDDMVTIIREKQYYKKPSIQKKEKEKMRIKKRYLR